MVGDCYAAGLRRNCKMSFSWSTLVDKVGVVSTANLCVFVRAFWSIQSKWQIVRIRDCFEGTEDTRRYLL